MMWEAAQDSLMALKTKTGVPKQWIQFELCFAKIIKDSFRGDGLENEFDKIKQKVEKEYAFSITCSLIQK